MRKKQIYKDTWLTLLITILILLLISGGSLLFLYLSPTEKVEEYAAYTYQHEVNLDYQVKMRPNHILPKSAQLPGRAYIKTYVDSINTEFDYNFIGNKSAVMSGDYSATASLIATVNNEESHVVWEKEYKPLSNKQFNANDEKLHLQDSIIIPLAEYLDYAESVIEATDFIPSDLNLIVQYNVNMKAETDDGIAEDELTPILTIPLGGQTFIVNGDLQKDNSGEITGTHVVNIDGIYLKRSIFFNATVVLFAALLSYLLLTKPKEERKKSMQEKRLSAILSKHRVRIVSLNVEDFTLPKNVLKVSSFGELLKLADELGLPILYPKSANGITTQYTFYVLTSDYAYSFAVEPELLEQENVEFHNVPDKVSNYTVNKQRTV